MEVFGEARIARFKKKHAQSRQPLTRFVNLLRAGDWRNLVELQGTFPSADYLPESGAIVFNIGGNKYRLVAVVNFAERELIVEAVMTHEEYDRKEV